MVKSYRDLIVWQKAMDLVTKVYGLLEILPGREYMALSDQMRRAAVSIPSNIAEGYGRMAQRDYARFLTIARGSVYELETQLLICVRLGYLNDDHIAEPLQLCDEISRMLYSIIDKVR